MTTWLLDASVLLVTIAGETPEPEDVKAGWTAFAVFLLLVVAVAVIGWSLTRQLRKTREARDAGVYGPVEDRPVDDGPAPGDDER